MSPPLPPVHSHRLAYSHLHGSTRMVLLEARHQEDGRVLWGILESNCSLTEPGVWEVGGLASSRTPEFLARARFTFEDALALWDRHLKLVSENGIDPELGHPDALAGGTRARFFQEVYDPNDILGREAARADEPR